jgi:hypothetical protein
MTDFDFLGKATRWTVLDSRLWLRVFYLQPLVSLQPRLILQPGLMVLRRLGVRALDGRFQTGGVIDHIGIDRVPVLVFAAALDDKLKAVWSGLHVVHQLGRVGHKKAPSNQQLAAGQNRFKPL